MASEVTLAASNDDDADHFLQKTYISSAKMFNMEYNIKLICASESTPLNKLAVADAAWARIPVDSLNMTLA